MGVEASGVVAAFDVPGAVLGTERYGSGNLNDTFLITLDATVNNQVVLQRVNQYVFREPALIMVNIRTFMDHIRTCRERADELGRRWKLPDIVMTKDGADYFEDAEGGFWRMLTFVEGARTFDTVQDEKHAWEVGYALGKFHNLISDLDPARLHDTLVGFHVTPSYLAHYDDVVAGYAGEISSEVEFGMDFVAARRDWASVLEDAVANGKLALHPIHGDPKVNNIMIDEVTGQAVSIVDLDTVKPGLIHYDIGDCLRSTCNVLGEETQDYEAVRFEPGLAHAILAGYLSMAKAFLTEKDYDYLYDSVRLIAFELGLRFFTDYLAGDVYFKTKYPEHNLYRALVQFKLTESIEAQEDAIRAMVSELRAE